jgi:hypothetical protein
MTLDLRVVPPLLSFFFFFFVFSVPSWRDHSVEPLRDPNPSDLLEVSTQECPGKGVRN